MKEHVRTPKQNGKNQPSRWKPHFAVIGISTPPAQCQPQERRPYFLVHFSNHSLARRPSFRPGGFGHRFSWVFAIGQDAVMPAMRWNPSAGHRKAWQRRRRLLSPSRVPWTPSLDSLLQLCTEMIQILETVNLNPTNIYIFAYNHYIDFEKGPWWTVKSFWSDQTGPTTGPDLCQSSTKVPIFRRNPSRNRRPRPGSPAAIAGQLRGWNPIQFMWRIFPYMFEIRIPMNKQPGWKHGK